MPLSADNSTTHTPSPITTDLVVISVIFPIISAASIYLRILARKKSQLPFYADDGWVMVTWIFTLALSVLVWVFSAKSGIKYYNISAIQGTNDSRELLVTQVDPISETWTGGRPRYNTTALGLAQVGTSIALDFAVLCLPLPVVLQLNMALGRKLAVSLIFWLGAL
ncbi:hypothetical protein VP1G_11195 [Cytospora mali]|uniref:Rhodopsin domain-containing protein n=1 Tax=Cytospora mali TaxID=578113 RepID=A0A194VBB7_CYTMA|nr:hypothetical protein VP1G_11195 [Valsa mali var. pyri (nom. inval.)]